MNPEAQVPASANRAAAAALVRRSERRAFLESVKARERVPTPDLTFSVARELTLLDPGEAVASGRTDVGWTTFVLPDSVPKRARVLLIECEMRMEGPDGSTAHTEMLYRPNSAFTDSYLLCQLESSGGSDSVRVMSQTLFPFDRKTRSFQYQVTPPGTTHHVDDYWLIRIIGYL